MIYLTNEIDFPKHSIEGLFNTYYIEYEPFKYTIEGIKRKKEQIDIFVRDYINVAEIMYYKGYSVFIYETESIIQELKRRHLQYKVLTSDSNDKTRTYVNPKEIELFILKELVGNKPIEVIAKNVDNSGVSVNESSSVQDTRISEEDIPVTPNNTKESADTGGAESSESFPLSPKDIDNTKVVVQDTKTSEKETPVTKEGKDTGVTEGSDNSLPISSSKAETEDNQGITNPRCFNPFI